jgi:hypothetical protein
VTKERRRSSARAAVIGSLHEAVHRWYLPLIRYPSLPRWQGARVCTWQFRCLPENSFVSCEKRSGCVHRPETTGCVCFVRPRQQASLWRGLRFSCSLRARQRAEHCLCAWQWCDFYVVRNEERCGIAWRFSLRSNFCSSCSHVACLNWYSEHWVTGAQ